MVGDCGKKMKTAYLVKRIKAYAARLGDCYLFIIGVFCSLLLLRAWPRVFKPDVWNEDGTQNLLSYLNNGFSSIFEPVNGYLIVVPKIISYIGASISGYYYPYVSTYIAWAATIIVLLIISKAPTVLNGRLLLAISCMLVPTDPEVFGLPLYTFWWVSLLLFVLVFWRFESRQLVVRSIIMVFAGLSSPVIVTLVPLFIARAIFNKKNIIDLILAIVGAGCALIQIYFMRLQSETGTVVAVASNSLNSIYQIIPKFFGGYVIGNIAPEFQEFFGVLLLCFIILTIFINYRNLKLWALFYLLMVSILMSITRNPIDILDPISAGPRYFFYPFVIISWFLIQLLFGAKSIFAAFSGLLLVFSAFNSLPYLTRNHETLNWQQHILSCVKFSEYNIPIQYDGVRSSSWYVHFTRDQCKRFLRDLGNSTQRNLFPYALFKIEAKNIVPSSIAGANSVKINNWLGKDYQKSDIEELLIYGSFLNSDADRGSIKLYLNRGDKLLYKSGPVVDNQYIQIEGFPQFSSALPASESWVVLDFSNEDLPNEFIVTFLDAGTGWGEWSAIALRKQNAK